MSFLSNPKRKIVTYGKASRKPTNGLFGNDPSSQSKTTAVNSVKEKSTEERQLIRSKSPAKSVIKPAQPTPKPATNLFDVPSSSEDEQKPGLRSPPPTISTSSRSVERPRPVKIISEKRKHVISNTQPIRREKSAATLFDVPSSSEDEDQPLRRKPLSAVTKVKKQTIIKDKVAPKQSQPTENQSSAQIRSVTIVNEDRKRKREVSVADQDAGANAAKPLEKSRETATKKVAETRRAVQRSVKHTPSAREQEQEQVEVVFRGPKRQRTPVAARSPPPRRGMQTGISAPARLTQMITEPEDTTMLEIASDPPVDEQNVEIDIEPPSTPPYQTPDHSKSKHTGGSITPRQDHLWKTLLSDGGAKDSPSELPMSELQLHTVKKGLASLARSSSDIPQSTYSRRTRLVDTLKRAAPDDNEESSEDDDESITSDMEARTPRTGAASDSTKTKTNGESSKDPTPYVQSQTRVTYGQERSYLQEQDENIAFDMLAEELSQPTTFAKSQSQSQQLYDLESDEDSQQKPRTVHDLRAAGTKQRLLEELDALVHELGGQWFKSISARRSALLELTTKLFKDEAVECFLDQGLDRQLVEHCSSTNDIVFTFAGAIAITRLVNGGASSSVLQRIHSADCFKHIVRMLDNDNDISRIIKERTTNMSKNAQTAVLGFRGKILESTMWGAITPSRLSPRLVALCTVDAVVRRSREANRKDALIDESTLGTLLSTLDQSLQDQATDQAILHPREPVAIGLALSVLESSSLFKVAQKTRSGWSVQHLQQFAVLAPRLLQSSTGDIHDRSTLDAEHLTLRIIVNVTNDSPRACNEFAAHPVVQSLLVAINESFTALTSDAPEEDAEDITHARNLDRLILAEGALMNLSEYSNSARSAALPFPADGASPSNLGTAVTHFLSGLQRADTADSLQAAELNIPYGYLAVLLGNLCLHPVVRKDVERLLPGGRLDCLIAAVESFIDIHQRMYREEFEGGEGERLTRRMREMVEKLKKG